MELIPKTVRRKWRRKGTALLFFEKWLSFVIETKTSQERSSARKVIVAGEQIF
jgi:hypothetical protein